MSTGTHRPLGPDRIARGRVALGRARHRPGSSRHAAATPSPITIAPSVAAAGLNSGRRCDVWQKRTVTDR